MRRFTAIVLAGFLLAAGCSSDDEGGGDDAGGYDPSSPTTIVGNDTFPTLGPLIAGTSSVVDGTFVWTDYAYDDRGADTEPGDQTDLVAAGGDAVYPTGWRNEADLIQTQLGLDDEGNVTVRVVLETLLDPDVPVVVVAIDTDGDHTTGEFGLGDSWTPAGGMGAEHVAFLRTDGAEVVSVEEVGSGRSVPLDVTIEAEANTIDVTLPLEPDGATWSVLTAAATVPEGPAEGGELIVHDLGLLGDQPFYQWQDYGQADLLAGRGDATDAMAEVDFAALAEGGTELADATSPGFHTYLYESDLDLGESVAAAADDADGLEYRGPYQPYLVYIPDAGFAEGEPMTVFLHGLTQNHLGSVITPDGGYLGTGRPLSEELHNLGQYAVDGLDFPPHNLTVWPLARGEGLYYRGIAEQDVLDVLDDATARFAPDPERIILSGGSMGGVGAFRLGALYPDRFSVVAPLIGFAPDDTVPLLGNLWNVPIRQINGAVDPLIPAARAEATTDDLDRLELKYRAWMLDDRGHEAGGFVYDCVFRSLPEFERVVAPAEIRYTVDPDLFVSEPSGLDLRYDHAYWVSDIEVAAGAESGSVTARSRMLEDGGGSFRAEHIDRQGASGPDGGDLCGDNPEVTTDDTWRERAVERTVDGADPQPVIEVETTDLAALTINVAAAGLDGEGAVVIDADGRVDVTLAGLEPGTTVTVGDDEIDADDDGTATFATATGETTASF